MKTFFKKNKVLCLLLLIIILWVVVTCIIYKIDFIHLQEVAAKNIEKCNAKFSDDLCSQLSVPKIPDTISIFFFFFFYYPIRIFAYFVYPIFIIIAVVSCIYNKIKTAYIRNTLTRMSYKNYISKIYLQSLKSLIILPFFIIVLFICSYILSNGNLIIPMEETAIIEQQYLNNFFQFSLVFIINIFLINWFVVNIAYIATIKSNHAISAIIGAYIAFWLIWIVLEAIIGFGIQSIFEIKNLTNSLSFANFWVYDHVISLPFMIGYAIILVVLTGIVAYGVGKNKERIVLSAEKTV